MKLSRDFDHVLAQGSHIKHCTATTLLVFLVVDLSSDWHFILKHNNLFLAVPHFFFTIFNARHDISLIKQRFSIARCLTKYCDTEYQW